MKLRRLIFLWVAGQDFVVSRLSRNLSTHRMLFTPGVENYRWVVGRWRAWRTFEMARRRVPAYREYLESVAPGASVRLDGWLPDLTAIPEMDKASYITAYGIEARCLDGVLPRRGVVADESSGSSGSPTNWVRGRDERNAVRQILQATFTRAVGEKPIFVLNAFSLGAWATGMNVSASLADVCIIKSTGPDMTKIIDTMKAFGPAYGYVIMGYPPFLKNLVDDPRIDLGDYEAIAGFGGEGLSENMRHYLLRSFREVIGSYGASDLEINMAVETDFTIALRQELARNPELYAELTDERHGVMPMVFQYNPFAYVFDSNAAGELVVTICRKENLSPRINYNIHDRGHVVRMPELTAILKRHGAHDVISKRLLDLPVLFHYGRSDLSVDYYGATVAPDSIRDFVYSEAALGTDVSTYRMISYEDHEANKQLLFAIELKIGVPAARFVERDVYEQAIAHLCRVNRDFEHAYRDAKPSTRPRLHLYAYGTGPFKDASTKLKHEYVWQLDATAAVGCGILDEPIADDVSIAAG
jgi:phenylacetate-CoA ligase